LVDQEEAMTAQIGERVFAVRVPAALGARLEQLAARENNHASATIRRLLSAAMDREDEARPAARPAKKKIG
jgi:hypothetical protein